MFEDAVAKLLLVAVKAISPHLRSVVLKKLDDLMIHAQKTDNPWDDVLVVMLCEVIKGPTE